MTWFRRWRSRPRIHTNKARHQWTQMLAPDEPFPWRDLGVKELEIYGLWARRRVWHGKEPAALALYLQEHLDNIEVRPGPMTQANISAEFKRLRTELDGLRREVNELKFILARVQGAKVKAAKPTD